MTSCPGSLCAFDCAAPDFVGSRRRTGIPTLLVRSMTMRRLLRLEVKDRCPGIDCCAGLETVQKQCDGLDASCIEVTNLAPDHEAGISHIPRHPRQALHAARCVRHDIRTASGTAPCGSSSDVLIAKKHKPFRERLALPQEHTVAYTNRSRRLTDARKNFSAGLRLPEIEEIRKNLSALGSI
jgi:hypothetical protein